MPSTIRDFTELTAVAVNDYFLVSDTSDVTNRDKRVSQDNLLGFAIADVGRLSQAQSYSGLKTFSAGLRFGGAPQSTFSWYEEGNWTPALTFGGAAVGMTYSAQQGYFTRIGNAVHAWSSFTLSAVGSSTGAAVIGGLPYALSNFANFRPAVSVYNGSMTYTGVLQAVLVNNSTSITLQVNNNGVSSNLTNAGFSSISIIGITAIYRTG